MKCFAVFLCLAAAIDGLGASPEVSIPILCYHRVSDGKPGNTTVTPDHFRAQLTMLQEKGFHVVPLADVMAWKLGTAPAPPAHSVVITFDDGHRSFFGVAQPIIDQFHVPVTQFLVTDCISNSAYCVTWDEVAKLAQDPLIDLESHTWSHPTFSRESERRPPADYEHLVDFELNESKVILESRLKHAVPMLAWPYGIYSPMLLEHAAMDGYKAGFSVECRSVTEADPPLAMPRCMVLDSDTGDQFLRFLTLADEAANSTPVNRNWRVLPSVER